MGLINFPAALRIVALAGILLADLAYSIDLDINDEQSIKAAASTTTYAMMTYYKGNESGQIPGAFPTKWWEGSTLFLALLQYWHFTGDTTYNDELRVGLEWQAGDDDYMPSNYSSFLGNDDQMFWGLAAMTAAELQFADATDVGSGYSWLSLAQGVFNSQIKRWDNTSCHGGMRWQIWEWESGYTMKNAISNGGLFQLSARLARYTHQAIYSQWAEKIWYWSLSTPLISNSTWHVADSTSAIHHCDDQGDTQWTYNYGTYMMGAAYMYNYTNGSTVWLDAVNGLLTKTFDTFLSNNILEEITCEPTEQCNDNDILFKGLLSSWLSFTALLVPSTYNKIMPVLKASAQAAAKSCTGHNNNTCGVRWYLSTYDGWIGMEEQISATNIFVANMIAFDRSAPVTAYTGGDSTSNPSAGETNSSDTNPKESPITAADKAGAIMLTIAFVGGWIGIMGFILMGS
ncbi:Mannan endo-1-6-alpha-mannosidase DCW1 [Penicillium chermesinum]|uniref:Mannan endo-1,6-alpha-mannosidase n=1 Tax=Penicillium chermesinum TaxID=63820 RepID=A0A9W9TFE3_9EURO|nr:Mannan endo-1-6-alpha-mannosidase DCW1 [Penicillium chermesinum]KAJ5219530.1 Mannan endo-1-6-alpha-mannosidase DCW1 [Penicillium chermesinum]KAJ6153550.1 Mannan endo-1-6-alpha-mannosidase DCW1 [Penicillium chermesinum]